jgi:hypothetical protein
MGSECFHRRVKEDKYSPDNFLTIVLDICALRKLFIWAHYREHDAIQDNACCPVQSHDVG